VYLFIQCIGKSRVLETLKNIQHSESQTYEQKTSIITSNKMVQTESNECKIVSDAINMEIRSIDECLAVYKTQVKKI